MLPHTVSFVICLAALLFINSTAARDLRQTRDAHNLWDKLKEKTLHHRSDKEGLLLFPDVAFPSLTNNQTWNIVIHGWRYQPKDQRNWLELSATLWINRLAHELDSTQEIRQLNGSINDDRVRPFFFTDETNEPITIQIGHQTHELRTDQYGQIYHQLEVTNDDVQQWKQQQQSNKRLTYEAVDEDGKKFDGSAYLIEPSDGLSVISDIDDTIKISNVLDRVLLLTNTFVFPFKPVAGPSLNF